MNFFSVPLPHCALRGNRCPTDTRTLPVKANRGRRSRSRDAADAYSGTNEPDDQLDDHQRQIRRKANPFLARAEEVRTAAESMQERRAREGMFRLVET
jgi:hypothetical protein